MNILDPRGPIAAADKQILIDSIAIMLAIVLPTIARRASIAVPSALARAAVRDEANAADRRMAASPMR